MSTRVMSGPTPGARSNTLYSTTKVYISHGRLGSRAQYYNIHLHSPDGELIVANALDAEFAACRVLLARGCSGRLEIYRHGSSAPAMIIRDLVKAAEYTVREDAHRSPCLRRYKPIPERFSRKTAKGVVFLAMGALKFLVRMAPGGHLPESEKNLSTVNAWAYRDTPEVMVRLNSPAHRA